MLVDEKINSVSSADFEKLRDYIKDNCGIIIGDGKEYLIESRFANLLIETGSQNFSEFYDVLVANTFPGLRDKVIDSITTHETSWFRDKYPFEILKDVILPEWALSNSPGKFRIWSCGCSTGQEAYSACMTIDSFADENDSSVNLDKIEVLATDISSAVLFMANSARFDKLSMKRGLDDNLREKYFETKGNIWKLDDRIKKPVSFKKFNLQDSFSSIGKFDLIFCRNVMIYFSNELKTELFTNFKSALRENGKLIIGSAETTFGYTDLYERNINNNGTYYTIKGE